MIISIECKFCESKHHDHWECDVCNYNFGFFSLKNPYVLSKDTKLWKFCPVCGTNLYPEVGVDYNDSLSPY